MSDKRLTFVIVGVGIVSGIILSRLFFLQVTHAEYYRAKAERQHAVSILTTPRRGDIFFEDKEGRLVPAASTKRVYTLAGNPQQIEDVRSAYDTFVAYIPLEEDAFFPLAESMERTYASFMRGIDKDTAQRIPMSDMKGFWLEEEETRAYPSHTLGSHLLGFVGFDGDERVGQYGIERMYDSVLHGKGGSVVGERSAGGTLLSIGRDLFREKQDGRDIVLTIDPNIQSFAAGQITALEEMWHPKSVGVLVVDPQTGAILAMEASPSFDPNTYGDVEDYNVFINPFTESTFEMGSIFKPLTMSIGLDTRSITEKTTYFDAGSVRVRDATIGNYDGRGRGWQSMLDILDQSLNTGSVFIQQQIGERAFRDYIERLGLGRRTGIDLPNEVAGNIHNLETGGEVEYATASFGQGIALTPIGITSALSSIANGGTLVRPYIVDRVLSEDTVVEKTETDTRRRVFKEETTEMVSRMLVSVVDNTLANGVVYMPEYSIAAKTGTAQIANSSSLGYSDEFLHTFFGYAPAYDPEFLIFYFLERPVGVRYASQTLSEPFREMTDFIINYYQILPDR
ncbi:MAG: hypothetical protein COU90_04560 [Candidatus Ryanbacteria bacterium CG10_big_fil_rev_8_21_14_0_10_43_42]|uniref:Penicillin-binding protein transpeptidase domain-containing protein n=1 Tax=Candidatus Ryanbacteria bacterium CG10_big_fil_rev_8_21_14_0_10_43_42 TaxID=1974864 RepID=A0A2M8KW08_9BACT|nr:MAG: hypothetical protein COU90_04560 [Candidatus Ryanbacteria bacterium CG10_big_fil_rev_8_21_14_0_10_43_42]